MSESIRLRTLMHERASDLVGQLNGEERNCLFLGLTALLRDLQTLDCPKPHENEDRRRMTDDRQ